MKVKFSYTLPDIIKNKIEDSPVFFNSAYKHILEKGGNKLIYFFSVSTEIITAAIMYRTKFLNQLRFIISPVKLTEKIIDEEEKEFIKDVIELIRFENIADRVAQPFNHCVFLTFPDNSINCAFGSYILNLENRTEEELFKQLHTKHRNVIKNAINKNVLVIFGAEQLDSFYNLYSETMQRNGMHLESLQEFKIFIDSLNQNAICGVAYYNNIPQGALLIPFNKSGAYYVYGASKENVEITGANNLLHWELIKLLLSKGVKKYDFVGARLSDISGTRLEGIQKFKSRFGPELKEGYLWKMDIKKWKCFLFDSMLSVKCKLSNTVVPKDIIQQELEKLKI